MGLLNATRSDIFRMMTEVHTLQTNVKELQDWADWESGPTLMDDQEQHDDEMASTPSDDSTDPFGNCG